MRKTFKNWPVALLFRIGLLNSFKGKLSWGEVEIKKDGLIRFYYKNRDLKFYANSRKGSFVSVNTTLKEIFVDDIYGGLDVKGKVVVDIGAYIGDSSVYFILKGAERVYAFEAYPLPYRLLLKTIKANNLEGRILPFNEALAKKPGKIKLDGEYEIHIVLP